MTGASWQNYLRVEKQKKIRKKEETTAKIRKQTKKMETNGTKTLEKSSKTTAKRDQLDRHHEPCTHTHT